MDLQSQSLQSNEAISQVTVDKWDQSEKEMLGYNLNIPSCLILKYSLNLEEEPLYDRVAS